MKRISRIILIIFIVCILAAAGFYAYQEFFLQKDLAPADLVPFGAVAYSHTYDLETKLTAFSKSKLVQGCSKISVEEFMEKMGAQPHEKMIVKMVLEQLNSETNRQLASQFFGQEVAVAFYASDKKEFGPEMWMDAASNIIIVTRLKPEVRFVELLTPVFSKLNQEVSEEEIPYKKHTIHLLSAFNNLVKIGYVRFGDLLVVGWGDRAAHRAIDVVSGDIQSLAGDPQFREAFPSQNEKADVSFFNYAIFAKKMKEYVLTSAMGDGEGWNKQVEDQFEESFKQMNGFRTIASVILPGAVTEIQSVIYYDPAQMHPDVLPFFQIRPQENKSLNFIPAEVVYYQWQGGINFKQYWLQAKEQMQKIDEMSGQEGASPEQFVQAMEGQAGMSIEKGILPLFGDEMGGFLFDIEARGPFPLPKLAVFIEVTDEVKVTELLNKMLDAIMFVRIEQEEYQNVYFRYASIPMVEGVTPACGVFNHYVICTTNRDLFKSMIDLSKGGADKKILSLKENPIFSNPQYRLTRPSSGVFFVNVSSLMDKLTVLVDVFEQWMLMQQSQQNALRSGAQKRLEDINVKISQSQEAFSALEQELVGLQGQKSAVPQVDEASINAIVVDIDRQEKIRDTFQGRLKDLLIKEEDLLAAVEGKDGQQLSNAGQARLTEVQEDISLQKKRVADLESKIEELTKKHQELSMAASSSADLQQTVSSQEKKLLQIRDEIRDDEEVRQEIEALLEGYAKQDSLSDPERTFLVNNVIKPFLAAFKNIHWVGGRMETLERTIKSDMMFEYE